MHYIYSINTTSITYKIFFLLKKEYISQNCFNYSKYVLFKVML